MLTERMLLGRAVSQPAADKFAGTLECDYVDMRMYDKGTFQVSKGAGATGTTLITVEADADGSGAGTAIPFRVREALDGDDLPGAFEDIAATGHETTAGENQNYFIDIDSSELPEGKPYVRIKAVEQVNDPCAGAVYFHGKPRYLGAGTMPTTVVS